MWFTDAYIKNIFVKLIFKTFTLEISKKKVRLYCIEPEYVAVAFVPVGSSSQDSLSNPEQIACYIGTVEKKINGE